ncbi:CUB and sushi domain-containing protein 3 [Trichonephila clavipes]|nr:CUB and sushi domain-containing protein 3 [Trichonephila clavipes]
MNDVMALIKKTSSDALSPTGSDVRPYNSSYELFYLELLHNYRLVHWSKKIMSSAAFFFGILTAVLVISISASCPRYVSCPCGSSNKNYRFCINDALNESYSCDRWAFCETCENNVTHCATCPQSRTGPFCSKVESEKIRRKRQYYTRSSPKQNHPGQFVNGDRYRAMITNFFISELNNHDVQELWFQQDGATCHTARATIDLLKDTLGDRLISRFGPVNWPPRSCDLTPLDYFLWGYVKSLVYADKPQMLDHLENHIRRVIADIRPQMLEKVIENWTSRLDYIRASRGSHMPEILFKISIPLKRTPFTTILQGWRQRNFPARSCPCPLFVPKARVEELILDIKSRCVSTPRKSRLRRHKLYAVSDESRFNLSSDDNRVRVWRPRGERLNPAFALQRHSSPTAAVMVWDAIAYNTRSPLVLICGTMTAQRYVHDILQPHVLPLMKRLARTIFQQETAQPHTSRLSQDCLCTVTSLPWPARSPDLSPIEHIWNYLGRRVGHPTSLNELEARVCTGRCLPGYVFDDEVYSDEMTLECRGGYWRPRQYFPPCKSQGHCNLRVIGAGFFNCTTGMDGTRCDVNCDGVHQGRYHCYPGRGWNPPLPYCAVPKNADTNRRPCRCENGGMCDDNGKCVCPRGRTGTYCERFEREKASCPDPGIPRGGERMNSDGSDASYPRIFEEGESVIYSCAGENLALQGTSFITCRSDGTWSASRPQCIRSRGGK